MTMLSNQFANAVRPKSRLCLIGGGAIGRRVAGFVADRLSLSIELVAVAERPDNATKPWWTSQVRLLADPGELAEVRPDIVLEAASPQAVGFWGDAALACARKFIVCSVSALADDDLRMALKERAGASGSQLVVPHGALGGLHALSAASLLPLKSVTHTIRKPPAAWRNTPAETEINLTALSEAATLFEGCARDAARFYPANANAVVLSSLAGTGLDNTFVRLIADPDVTQNIHEVAACGAFGELSFRIANEPMQANPKTSDMTALSLVRLLESETMTLVV